MPSDALLQDASHDGLVAVAQPVAQHGALVRRPVGGTAQGMRASRPIDAEAAPDLVTREDSDDEYDQDQDQDQDQNQDQDQDQDPDQNRFQGEVEPELELVPETFGSQTVLMARSSALVAPPPLGLRGALRFKETLMARSAALVAPAPLWGCAKRCIPRRP